MGLTHVAAVVRPTASRKGPRATVKFLVDSGASYSLLPLSVWKRLGLKPRRKVRFTLADGTEVVRSISEAHFTFRGVEGHSPVVLGERSDEALLGIVTLESLGLVLNPFDRTLQPMRMMLA